MLEEFEQHEEDEETLKELKQMKKTKSFSATINKRNMDKFELDEIMG